MEWLLGIVGAILVFFAGILPTFGAELVYRMPGPASLARPSATVLFGGDVMLDRSLRAAMEKEGEDFIFSCLGDTLKEADLTIVNLEGPITENPSVSISSNIGDPNNTRFAFAPRAAALLKRQGIDVVSIANNHAYDFGADGVRSTMRLLREAGVQHFGEPFAESDYRTEVRGVPLAFIGYNEFQTHADGTWGPSTSTVHRIEGARADGYLPIVFAHWGDEYEPVPERVKRLAREWIDAGAELVIGAHPHIVQEHEVFAGKHIYYSLGNLFFDQYWNDAVREGLLVEVTFSSNGVQDVREMRTYLERDRRTCLLR